MFTPMRLAASPSDVRDQSYHDQRDTKKCVGDFLHDDRSSTGWPRAPGGRIDPGHSDLGSCYRPRGRSVMPSLGSSVTPY